VTFRGPLATTTAHPGSTPVPVRETCPGLAKAVLRALTDGALHRD